MTTAQYLARLPSVRRSDIAALGGQWLDAYACFEFPDHSCGCFTDIVRSASLRDSTGQPVLHFVELLLDLPQ
ncbi:MAG TPA: hypothetical protein VH187_01520 [Scandinavium sp.]|jgi:hypothetical protein|uniref:hypothetical protein n=1 Tax=Scandinavium sp. TaxID=2830653 RepID=UPI002E35CE3A|nr:hypothetical protein [Scandinavium sp.]HEX4499837.1 hypothetical protein [Scandinavium sp.]